MGGYGSTRWEWHNKKNTADESKRIVIKDLLHAIRAVSAGQSIWWGAISWTYGGQPNGNISYQVENQGVGLVLRLLYTSTDRHTGQESLYDYLVGLQNTPVLVSAVRWWFTCPNCSRRCGTLYLPPGAHRFACRHCHDLTYASCQQERKAGTLDKLIPGLAALDALLKFERTGKVTKALRFAKFSDGLTLVEAERNEQQALLQTIQDELANRPKPYANYLTVAELCEWSGLTLDDLAILEGARLLLPDHDGKYRPKLVGWGKKLAYLLREGWGIDEIKEWTKGRWKRESPRQWPPEHKKWKI